MDALDLIAIGRSSVDLYGQQIGCALEDMQSFRKSVGGCPSNIAIGAARLGLRAAVITRVGDEQMGRYILAQFAREGVSTRGVIVDKSRPTALAILAVKDREHFPLLFYRENCADMALDASEIDPDFIRSAGAVLITGTHLARDNVRAASRKAVTIAKEAGRKVILDIDYRPNLWGLAGRDAGDARYVSSAQVSAVVAEFLADCDLIVGTEEEMRIAGGAENVLDALRAVRARSQATIVLKRGPQGCRVYPGAIPDSLDAGIAGQSFAIEVYNVLGAGDGFMAGFLRGWLRGESLETCATWANACGAIVVSRLLCSAEIPTWTELRHFLTHGSAEHALRHDHALTHLHAVTTRRWPARELLILAMDHRLQLEALAGDRPDRAERLAKFKTLGVRAALRVADGRPGFGMLLDDQYGRDAQLMAVDSQLWIARPVERAGSRPLEFDFDGDLASMVIERPLDHTIKCLAFYHPDDPEALRAAQLDKLVRLDSVARRFDREYLIEVICSKHGPVDDGTIARALEQIYARGVMPDWWKLEPQSTRAAWERVGAAIERHDPHCRGILVLGLDAPEETLVRSFELARSVPQVRGFAVGRTIFGATAKAWLAGEIDDARAVDEMAARYRSMCEAWTRMRALESAT